MDLTTLTEQELQQLANIGNFAAMSELASRRSADNTTKDMTAIERENLREAIKRNLITDKQGDIRTFDIPKDDIDMDAYSDSELMESDTTSKKGIVDLLMEGGSKVLDFIGSGGIVGNVVDSLGDMFQYRGAGPSITNTPLAQYAFRDELRRDPNFDIAAALDKQNALGGYYSDFARGQRSLAGRYSNLLDRARSGKNFSRRNLLNISKALGMGIENMDDIDDIRSEEHTSELQSRSSGNVEVDLPTSDDPGTVGGSSFDAETGGTFGTSTNDASTFSDYS